MRMKVAVHQNDPTKEINEELQQHFFKEDSVFMQLCWNRIIHQRTHSYLKELNEDMITKNKSIRAFTKSNQVKKLTFSMIMFI